MRKAFAGIATALFFVLICAVCYLTLFFSSQTSKHFISMAENAEARQKLQHAAYYYGQALVYNPYSTYSRLKLADMSVSADDYNSAQLILQNGINVSPSNPAFYLQLGRLYMRQNQLEEGVNALNLASGGFASMRVGALRPSVQAHFSFYGADNAAHFKINMSPYTDYYYTLDGTFPTFSSSKYKHPIVIDSTVHQIYVVAVCNELPSPLLKYSVDSAK